MSRLHQLEQQYTMGAELSRGTFGAVFAMTDRENGKQCAVKVLDATYLGKDGNRRGDTTKAKLAKTEMKAWRAVSGHPNVVELLGAFASEDGAWFLLMEMCHFSLREVAGGSPVSSLRGLVAGMLQGVCACHEASIVHRDVRAENFSIAADGRTVKLGGFCVASRLPSKGGLRGEFGEAAIMSPEMLAGKEYGTATDVWSFGVAVYLMAFKELPYGSSETTEEGRKVAVKDGALPRFLRAAGQPAEVAVAQFLWPLLQRESSSRCTASAATKLPFLLGQ